MSEPFVEGFRLLALDIERMLDGDRNRAILVMSAMPREGRSLTAAHLARVLVEVSPPVALVDANPEGADPEHVKRALADVVGDAAFQWIRPWTETKTQAGVIDYVRRIVEDARRVGGTVVIDVPAATTSSLGFFLAPTAAGVIYVARTRRIPDLSVASAVRSQLDLLGARILGVVVNEG